MVNRCEPVLTGRHLRASQRSCRLGPKGEGGGQGPRTSTPRGQRCHPADSRHLTSHGLWKRNVETSYHRPKMDMARSFLPKCIKHDGWDRSGPEGARSSLPRKRPGSFWHPDSLEGKRTARKADGGAGKDAGRSERRPVMGRIRDAVPGPKGSPRPAGAPSRKSPENRHHEGKRKTAKAGAPSTLIKRFGGCRCVSRRPFETERTSWVGIPAFGVLEPCAGKLARTVLRGVGGR